MNLHSIASGYISAVNPMTGVILRISAGPSATQSDGRRTNTFQTPGAFNGEIAGTVLTVDSIASGVLAPGQSLIDSQNLILPGTVITAQLTGDTGGPGTYSINQAQTVDNTGIFTFQLVLAQIQPLSGQDLRQIDGLNLQGDKKAIYISGDLSGIVRLTAKGGDLVTLPDSSVWLINNQAEPWSSTAGWTKGIMTLQNQRSSGPLAGLPPSLDFSKPGNSQYLAGLVA